MKKFDWKPLYSAAKKAQTAERTPTPFMKGGYVSTAVLTNKGNIYVAVNLDSRCALNFCSERIAIYKVFEANKNEYITHLVCLYRDHGPSMPCGACREFLMQFSPHSPECEILLNLKTGESIKLGETMPLWWGASRYGKPSWREEIPK
ncbi:MAG: cytidine deaminase [Firmicutes bacterium]|nr:cytidine deaminase [Bacillota bacterium]